MTNTIFGSENGTIDDLVADNGENSEKRRSTETEDLLDANLDRVKMEPSDVKSEYIKQLYIKTNEAKKQGNRWKAFGYNALNGIVQSDFPDKAPDKVKKLGQTLLDYIL